MNGPDYRHMQRVLRVIAESPSALLPAEILAHPDVRLTGGQLGDVLRSLEARRAIERCLVVIRGQDATGFYVGAQCRPLMEEA